MNTNDVQLYFEGKQIPAAALTAFRAWLARNEEQFTYALRNVHAAGALVKNVATGMNLTASAPEAFLNTGRIVVRFKSEGALPLFGSVETVLVITGIRINPNSIVTEGNVPATITISDEFADERVFPKIGWVNMVNVPA